MVWTVSAVASVATGVLFVALGAWVASLRPRSRATVWFALFAVLFGAFFVIANIPVPILGKHYAATPLAWPISGLTVAAGGAAILFAHHATRLPERPAWTLWVAVAVGASYYVLQTLAQLLDVSQLAVAWEVPTRRGAFFVLWGWPHVGGTLAAGFLVALRALAGERPSTHALLGALIMLYPSSLVFHDALQIAGDARLQGDVLYMAGVLFGAGAAVVCGAIWFAASLRHGGDRGETAAGFVAIAAMTLGLLRLLPEGYQIGIQAARLLAVAGMAYAILRHRLFGLDVKVKWTFKQSTVAAVFVAVFFIVSEAAAAILGERTGSEYWGIAGAGLLVFAIHPLQRLAEKLSDKAMPGVKPVIAMDDAERAFAYEQAARLAWQDGYLSKDERAMLDGLRDRLGLSASDAAEIESSAAG